MSQEVAGGPGELFKFEPAEGPRTPGARLLLHGRIAPTGIHGGASPAELGEGRGQPPTPPPDPRKEQPSESSDSESDEEGVPKRNISATPPSGRLNNAVIGQKTDIGWNEDRLLYGRFPKFQRVFLGRDPGTLKSDIVSTKIFTINLFGFEILRLKIRRLKLWKPTIPSFRLFSYHGKWS